MKASPATVRRLLGVEVPMPTLPPEAMVSWYALSAVKLSEFAPASCTMSERPPLPSSRLIRAEAPPVVRLKVAMSMPALATASVALGVVVPMPTLPDESMRKRSVPVVVVLFSAV